MFYTCVYLTCGYNYNMRLITYNEFIRCVLKNAFGGGHLSDKFNLVNFDKRGHRSYDMR